MNDTWAKLCFEILAILVILLGDKMAYLGPIDFKIGLYIKINVKEGQNKFDLSISQSIWPNGHNSVIFHPIFIKCSFLKTHRMVTITKLYFF